MNCSVVKTVMTDETVISILFQEYDEFTSGGELTVNLIGYCAHTPHLE